MPVHPQAAHAAAGRKIAARCRFGRDAKAAAGTQNPINLMAYRFREGIWWADSFRLPTDYLDREVLL
jgi:hypothetical protein